MDPASSKVKLEIMLLLKKRPLLNGKQTGWFYLKKINQTFLTLFDKIILGVLVMAVLIIVYLLLRRSHWRLIRDGSGPLGFAIRHFPPRSGRLRDLEEDASSTESRITALEQRLALFEAAVQAVADEMY